MKLINTLIIILIIIIGYLVLDYFKLVEYYWDIIDLLPIPNNFKKIIKFFKKNIHTTKSIANTYNSLNYTCNSISNNKEGKITRKVSQIKKKIVASNQKWKCKSCGALLDYSYEVDHIIPLYKGGSNEIINLQALCRNCHGKKTIEDEYT
jgi:5-methylcytosine-specific restriction protein A